MIASFEEHRAFPPAELPTSTGEGLPKEAFSNGMLYVTNPSDLGYIEMWIDNPRQVIMLICSLGQVVCGLIALPLLFRMIWLLRPRSKNAGHLDATKNGRNYSQDCDGNRKPV